MPLFCCPGVLTYPGHTKHDNVIETGFLMPRGTYLFTPFFGAPGYGLTRGMHNMVIYIRGRNYIVYLMN